MRVGENGHFCQVWVCINEHFVQIHSGGGWDSFGNVSTWDEAGLVHQGQFQLCGSSLNQDMLGTPSGRTEFMENQRFTVRN